MKKVLLLSALFLVSTILFAEDKGAQILLTSDQYRNAWPSFVVRIRITSFKNDKQKNARNLEVMVKGDKKSLVRFLDPDQKGQYLLMLDDNMWIFAPNTRRPIRISPLQRLLGEASNGDVADITFAENYNATSVREETVGGRKCFKLELTASNDKTTYQRVEYWVTKTESLPVKAELYLASGKHYKSVTYDEFKMFHNRLTLTQMTLHDRLRNNSHTVMEFLEYEPQTLAEKYFNKNYLTQLK